MGCGPRTVSIGSMIAMSTTWPRPVRSRPWSAAITAYDVERAAIESARPNGGSVGGPSGSPVSAAKPLIASASVPNPGRGEYGPNWPKAVTRVSTRRGLAAFSSSQPRFHFSRVPGRKFSISTSASATSLRRISRPPGVERSSVMFRLLRPRSFHHRPTPSFDGPWPRDGSGLRGCSTLITSAPKSPSMVAASGPAEEGGQVDDAQALQRGGVLGGVGCGCAGRAGGGVLVVIGVHVRAS